MLLWLAGAPGVRNNKALQCIIARGVHSAVTGAWTVALGLDRSVELSIHKVSLCCNCCILRLLLGDGGAREDVMKLSNRKIETSGSEGKGKYELVSCCLAIFIPTLERGTDRYTLGSHLPRGNDGVKVGIE